MQVVAIVDRVTAIKTVTKINGDIQAVTVTSPASRFAPLQRFQLLIDSSKDMWITAAEHSMRKPGLSLSTLWRC